jgi:guanylate kinase
MKEKVIIFSAPSGSGKSTVVKHLLDTFDCFELSVSCTSRAPRGVEQHGREYYFITPEEFRALIAEDAFVEHEEVYNGVFYGTLKKEVRRIWDAGHAILFDVDVKGGVNLKRYFGDKALSVFVQAPSVEVLRERLVKRATDSTEFIEERVRKAAEEMTYAPKFDYRLVNDDLQTCLDEADRLITDFLAR